jgi:serine phosphatase RsbU (regulator of sigma subunit)
MASIRYAIRAHATQGDGPATILQKLGTVLQVTRDRHFATVVCVEVHRTDRTLRVAAAGHPPPLLIVDGSASFIEVEVGPPVGIDAGRTFAETTTAATAGATMLLFTDGLFERRGEPIDESLERLRRAAEGVTPDLDQMLGNVLDSMIEGGATDDTALLGVRWRG